MAFSACYDSFLDDLEERQQSIFNHNIERISFLLKNHKCPKCDLKMSENLWFPHDDDSIKDNDGVLFLQCRDCGLTVQKSLLDNPDSFERQVDLFLEGYL